MASVTVKGTGSLSVTPDLIRINLDLQTRSRECDEAMDMAEAALNELREILCGCGFEKDALKTSCFDVHTEYESQPDEHGNYRSVFKGYCCSHTMNVEFDLDTGRLAEVLKALSGSEAAPQLSVNFTVRNTESVRGELIRQSAASARNKAELLCEASGVKLGKLLKINYDRSDMNFVSEVRYGVGMDCLRANAKGVSIDPADIKLTDCAEFEWEIN